MKIIIIIIIIIIMIIIIIINIIIPGKGFVIYKSLSLEKSYLSYVYAMICYL